MPPLKVDEPLIPESAFKHIPEKTNDAPQKIRKNQYVWINIIFIGILPVGVVIYAIYLIMTRQVMWSTHVFGVLFAIVTSMLGINAGSHRLWAHKAYKARWPLRLILMLANTVSFQGYVLAWARDHRMHHRYSETDADPHNSSRGFFFSHIGWLFVRKHPDIKAKAHTVDMSDLYADPILQFQKKYYFRLLFITNAVCVYIPTLWGESAWNALIICVLFRIIYMHHITFLVNSAAHIWGNKPYDKNIAPVENKIVSWFAFGEGFHNYHHAFPWDYKAAELGIYWLNPTALFIEVMAKVGLAYDLKTVNPEIIKNRIQRTGDGSHES